jgi:hypothetical protein
VNSGRPVSGPLPCRGQSPAHRDCCRRIHDALARVFLTVIQPDGTFKAVNYRGSQSPSGAATTVEMATRQAAAATVFSRRGLML